jgi:prepilin-type N-terminal cleavage/methylation domain-containing protein
MNRATLLPRCMKAFTLPELLVSVAIIAILAALLFPVLSHAKARGQRTACLNNLKQIAVGVHLYAADFNDVLFPIAGSSNSIQARAIYEWTAYNPLMRGYVGLNGAPSPQDKLFACPTDTYYYGSTNSFSVLIPQSFRLRTDFNFNFTSYLFNAGNAAFQFYPHKYPGMFPGIMGSKLSFIKNPGRAVLVSEFPALEGYSWHQPVFSTPHHYNNARDMLSFADGHVSYIKMYCGSNNPSHSFGLPFCFDPPAGYDYQWSGD